MDILLASKEKKASLKEWIVFFVKTLNLPDLLRNSEQYPDEIDNLNNLYIEVSDKKYKDYDTNKFSKLGKPEKQITITTRHSSKGLEFEVIVMMGMDEDHFPGWRIKKDPDAIKEENRICFVCVSRAKRVCILMHSNSYIEDKFGKKQIVLYQPSRYFIELRKKYGGMKD